MGIRVTPAQRKVLTAVLGYREPRPGDRGYKKFNAIFSSLYRRGLVAIGGGAAVLTAAGEAALGSDRSTRETRARDERTRAAIARRARREGTTARAITSGAWSKVTSKLHSRAIKNVYRATGGKWIDVGWNEEAVQKEYKRLLAARKRRH